MNDTRSIDIREFINARPFSGFQWLVFAICITIVLLDGFDTASIGFIAPSLLGEWHLDKPALAPVLSAALFGLACGAIVSGPLSDRLGRRTMLLGSVTIFGLACLASAYAGSLEQLTTLRFITGIGLGAAMPNAVTMMTEYCPESRRALITNTMFCGFPVGAAFGGFLAAWMIPQFGWRSVLVLGGVVPLLLVLIMLVKLPESVRYMAVRGKPAEKIRAALRRISPDADAAESFTTGEAAAANNTSGAQVVVSRTHLVGSIMLWLAYFMGLVIFYGVINWMPVLLKEAGLSPQSATLTSALFPLGGVGAILSGVLMDRFNGNKIVAACYALTALSIYLVGQAVGNAGLLMLIVFVAGVLMNTAQSSLPALAAAFYPTAGRGTGVAWMLGIGRFGGIAGSMLVAALTAEHYDFSGIFSVLAIGGIVSAAALVVKQLAHPHTGVEQAGKAQPIAH